MLKMEQNVQRKVKLPVDKILRTLNLSGSTGTGMSSTPTQMTKGLLEEWGTSPTPQPKMTYVDPASRAIEFLHAQEPSAIGEQLTVQTGKFLF